MYYELFFYALVYTKVTAKLPVTQKQCISYICSHNYGFQVNPQIQLWATPLSASRRQFHTINVLVYTLKEFELEIEAHFDQCVSCMSKGTCVTCKQTGENTHSHLLQLPSSGCKAFVLSCTQNYMFLTDM